MEQEEKKTKPFFWVRWPSQNGVQVEILEVRGELGLGDLLRNTPNCRRLNRGFRWLLAEGHIPVRSSYVPRAGDVINCIPVQWWSAGQTSL